MRRLIRTLAGRRANGERGAVLVLTAVLVMFVAIGMLALTVDLGNITYNRAQLQNGADASSLALATACANSSAASPTCGITGDLRTLATKNANATDQSMSILPLTSNPSDPDYTKTCIHSSGAATSTLPPCPTSEDTTSLTSCQPVPNSIPATASYVEVTTQTEMKNGADKSILPFHFAQILTGEQGARSQTCARAAWGPPGSTGPTLPITMGLCDWNAATANGTSYASAGPYVRGPGTPGSKTLPQPPDEVPRADIVPIYLNTESSPKNKCAGNPSGGFSWLDPNSGSQSVPSSTSPCAVDVSGGTAYSKTGNPPPCDITSYLGQIVSVPIYSSYDGQGDDAPYTITGIASFYFAGFDNFTGPYNTGQKKTLAVYAEPGNMCIDKNDKACGPQILWIWGWFVSSILPIDSATIGTGPDLGAHVVVPAG